ncbi:hypothetical protein ACMHYB_15795 [Sorangium sp. So ce1128]
MIWVTAATIPSQLMPWSEMARTVGGAPSHPSVRTWADQAPGWPCTTASIEVTLPDVTSSRPSRRETSARICDAEGHFPSAPSRRTHDTSAAARSHSSADAAAGAIAAHTETTATASARMARALTIASHLASCAGIWGRRSHFLRCGASSRRGW